MKRTSAAILTIVCLLLPLASSGQATSLPRPCPADAPPVCAIKDGGSRTYANRCEALRRGARQILPGACRRTRTERPTICPMIYAPVCALKDGRFKTYSNACMARGAGAVVQENFACVVM